MLRDEPWPQLGDFGMFKVRTIVCATSRGEIPSLACRTANGQLRHEVLGAANQRVETVVGFAVQHLFHELVQDGSPGRAAGDRQDGCSTASSINSVLPKMGWRSTSAGAAASLRLGWRHSIL